MRDQKGLTLLEVVIAVAVFGIIAAGLFMALNVSLKATALTDRLTTAESLTRSALEIIKQCDYTEDDPQGVYQGVVAANMEEGIPDGYDYDVVVTDVEPIDPVTYDPLPSGEDQGIQKVTVEVKFEGALVVSTDAYKVDR